LVLNRGEGYMKKEITILLSVLSILVIFLVSLSNFNNKKIGNLTLSENSIAIYPSERGMLVLTSKSHVDATKLQIKSKDIDVQKVGCTKVDGGDTQCLLSFSGFKPTNEKVEIRYDNQVYYVNIKIKSLDKPTKNMSLDEQYQIALAKLLTKYHVLNPDDIKDEKVRSRLEDELQKLADKYSDPKDNVDK
jgi:hypothetical protein